MKRVIVSTTINPVTEAIEKFQRMEDWDLVVVGDKKTPKDYRLENGIYIGPDLQEEYDKPLSDAIGWNCIERRNFGLLWAHDMRADIVALIDDDNIPYDNWGKSLYVGKEIEVPVYETELPAFDPVGLTKYKHLWHRGYPLELVPKREYVHCSRQKVWVDAQADFWDGDPDIDAICRMIYAPVCVFDEPIFPFSANKISPFNSQNTFISGRLLKDFFLFAHTGRMNDIWASYYVQSKGYKVVYGKPSVYQKRNVHNLVEDMKQEYLGYENSLRLIQDLAEDPARIKGYLSERSFEAFSLYRRHFGDA